MNVSKSPRLVEAYSVRSVPTLLLFRGGQIVDRVVGYIALSDLIKRMEPYLPKEEEL